MNAKEKSLKKIKKCYSSEHMNNKKEDSLMADTEKVLVIWAEDQTTSHNIPLNQNLIQRNGVSAKLLSHVQLFATPWTVARQAPLSMRFSRQEYWTGLPCPPPGHVSSQEIEPPFPALQMDSLLLSHQESPNPKKGPIQFYEG